MPIKRYKGSKGKCDVLASKITRAKGYCERCGTSEGLTTSHIIGRKYSATRTLEANLQCLCFRCHRRFTDFPREFSHWITESIGSEKYEELRAKAETIGTRFDWDAELLRLKAIAKEMGIE